MSFLLVVLLVFYQIITGYLVCGCGCFPRKAHDSIIGFDSVDTAESRIAFADASNQRNKRNQRRFWHRIRANNTHQPQTKFEDTSTQTDPVVLTRKARTLSVFRRLSIKSVSGRSAKTRSTTAHHTSTITTANPDQISSARQTPSPHGTGSNHSDHHSYNALFNSIMFLGRMNGSVNGTAGKYAKNYPIIPMVKLPEVWSGFWSTGSPNQFPLSRHGVDFGSTETTTGKTRSTRTNTSHTTSSGSRKMSSSKSGKVSFVESPPQ